LPGCWTRACPFDQPEVERIDVDISAENTTARNPASFRAWLSNSLRILQGARLAMLERGLLDASTMDAALAAMLARIDKPEGVSLFPWDRVTARKKGGSPACSRREP
jgi:hypothetical protein